MPLNGKSDAPVWTPEPSRVADSNITNFCSWLSREHGLAFGRYQDLHRWSVDDAATFWPLLLGYFDVIRTGEDLPTCAGTVMPGISWFPGVKLNYVDQVLRHASSDGVAIIDVCEPEGPGSRTLTWRELRRQVAAVAARLRELGVGPGDRVAGYLPNVPEAVIAFLATASLGAIWSSCGQDYSAEAAASRLGQLDPVVLVSADGYRYRGKAVDRRAAVKELQDRMPTIRTTIMVARLGREHAPETSDVIMWAQASFGDHELEPVRVPFDHPLWVLFSSGTTGRPKGIVHGHGGVVIEHLKQMSFHLDLSDRDTYFWYASPSWMMWNFQIAGLLVGSTIVTYDGDPAYPAPDALWALASRHRVTMLGTSPAYLQNCAKAAAEPADEHDLSSLRTVGSTGSVLPTTAYDWVAQHVGRHVALASTTGGTDVVSAFAGFVPTEPVWPGELSVPCLGVALESWSADGSRVTDEVGELVITRPLPSMPVFFWDDADGSRYHDSYFDVWPDVWRHGDWITITSRGSVIVHGRSDSTLNRNGVRMGSADIYQAVERLAEIRESLVLGVEFSAGDYWMPLFVVLTDGVELSHTLREQIRQQIRNSASPKHLPDDIIAVPGIPHTKTGKKLEIPLKRLMQGAAIESVVDPQSTDEPALLELFQTIATEYHAARSSPTA